MKVLLLDIETAPNLAYVWGVYQQDIQVNHMVSSSTTLCWSAKWLDGKRVLFDSVHESSHEDMLRGIHKLLDEADVVVHYNGRKFDIPTLNKEFLLAGMPPPSPYKQVDMLMVARGAFRFQSNKLDYVAQQLQLGKKVKHEGFQLWVSCMKGNGAAWKRMRAYNQGDVLLLEKLYKRMLPWIKGHPNRSAHAGLECCPHCGSKHLQRRGEARNAAGSYPRYQCADCGAWARGSVAATRPGKRMVAHG
jgi:DNA polymerase elongation subunit (family B)